MTDWVDVTLDLYGRMVDCCLSNTGVCPILPLSVGAGCAFDSQGRIRLCRAYKEPGVAYPKV
jgi:hypothetical protein